MKESSYSALKLPGFTDGKDVIINFPEMRSLYFTGKQEVKSAIKNSLDGLAIDIGRAAVLNRDIEYLTNMGLIETVNLETGKSPSPTEEKMDREHLTEASQIYMSALSQIMMLKKEIVASENHGMVV
jgi:hypothetical protein